MVEFLIILISRKYEIKKQVIGEDPDLEKSGRTLNRVIEWNRDGITIEADQRHVREILKDLEWERANHSATPCAVERKDEGGARRDEQQGGEPMRTVECFNATTGKGVTLSPNHLHNFRPEHAIMPSPLDPSTRPLRFSSQPFRHQVDWVHACADRLRDEPASLGCLLYPQIVHVDMLCLAQTSLVDQAHLLLRHPGGWFSPHSIPKSFATLWIPSPSD